jgi:hypothetical protein
MLTSEPEEGKCSVSCRKRTCLFFECFPYVCPEPVLVKRYMFSIKWHRKKTRFPPPHRVAVKFETGVQAHVREVVLRPGGCRDRPVDADAHVYDTQYSTYTRDQMATAAAAAAAAAVVSDSSNERFSGDKIRGGAEREGRKGQARQPRRHVHGLSATTVLVRELSFIAPIVSVHPKSPSVPIGCCTNEV